jgi:acyl-CoA thioesterase
MACNPANPSPSEADTITVAAGVDINFLKPAYQGQVITAVANRRANNGRSGLYDIQIFAADASEPSAVGSPDDPGSYGELVAEFRGRSRTISKK